MAVKGSVENGGKKRSVDISGVLDSMMKNGLKDDNLDIIQVSLIPLTSNFIISISYLRFFLKVWKQIFVSSRKSKGVEGNRPAAIAALDSMAAFGDHQQVLSGQITGHLFNSVLISIFQLFLFWLFCTIIP